MEYSLDLIKARYDNGEVLKFLFFWGHQPAEDNSVNKSCLSQWWQSPFKVEGVEYKTAEHWMMAEKARLFEDIKTLELILNCRHPAEAKNLGRQVQAFDQKIWDGNKYQIVKTGNLHKFGQNKALAKYLVNTGHRILVEASPLDKVWGIGKSEIDEGIKNPHTWDGLNLLGFALMEVREAL